MEWVSRNIVSILVPIVSGMLALIIVTYTNQVRLETYKAQFDYRFESNEQNIKSIKSEINKEIIRSNKIDAKFEALMEGVIKSNEHIAEAIKIVDRRLLDLENNK